MEITIEMIVIDIVHERDLYVLATHAFLAHVH
jgi:hypothetical protein